MSDGPCRVDARTGGPGIPDRSRNRYFGRWSEASLAAVVLLVAAVLVFAIIPDWLASGVLAGSPLLRDLLIVAWVTAGFVVLAWLVVRFQSGQDL